MSQALHSLRRGARLAVKLGCFGAALLCLLAGVASWSGGWIVPPVVSSPSPDDWELVSIFYPEDRTEVEIGVPGAAGENSVVLRGLHLATDEAGPLVVHFAGSGVSLKNTLGSFHLKTQYADLAHRGFSSLCVDYRGVGDSEGEPSPTQLGADAQAIWRYALELVDGDPGRIILRGCSIGTVAIAELLHAGVEPAGVVMVAPIEPSNVALRYGLAWLPGQTARLAQPFLRPFSKLSVTDELVRAAGPRLAIAHASDELFGEDGFGRLQAALLASGGELDVPTNVPGLLFRFGPVVDFMPCHIGLARRASELTEAEASFLERYFADQLPLRDRVERLVKALSPGVAERVAATPGAMDRLRWICARRRFLAPDLTAAVAVAFDAEELESQFDSFVWPSRKSLVPKIVGRWRHPFDDLVELQSPRDLTGPMPPDLLRQARLVAMDLPKDAATGRRLEEPLRALAVMVGAESTGPLSRLEVGDLGVFERDSEGRVLWVGAEEGAEPRRVYRLEALLGELAKSLSGGSTLQKRLERCLLKANGHLPG